MTRGFTRHNAIAGAVGLVLLAGSWVTAAASAATHDGPAMLAAKIDLRTQFEMWGLKVRQQSNRPTCCVFTYRGELELKLAHQRQQGER